LTNGYKKENSLYWSYKNNSISIRKIGKARELQICAHLLTTFLDILYNVLDVLYWNKNIGSLSFNN
tara:strand:+ start:5504 stop:5701 length:198 start_codon:yes stop_codon:yes gene_type:complete